MDSVIIVLFSIAMFIGGIVRIKYSEYIKDINEDHSTITNETQGPFQQAMNVIIGFVLIIAGIGFFIFGITGGTF